MSWRIVADWKPGMKDSNGDSLEGSIPVWNGKTKREADMALERIPKIKVSRLKGQWKWLENFRVERV